MGDATSVTPVRKRSWRMPVAVTIVVVAFSAAGVRLLPLTAAASPTRSVAVLPFENKGPAEQAYFADNIVDELRDKLARLENLKLIASAIADQYRQMTKTCIDIAKELHVDLAAADIDRGDAPRALQRPTRVRVNGQNEQALDHLERSCRHTPFFTPGWLKLDPMYEPLRGTLGSSVC